MAIPLSNRTAREGGDQAIVIRVQDVPALIAKQGGAAGSLFTDLVPQTMVNLVYAKMQEEFAKGLKEKGVTADVQVVYNPPVGGRPPKDFFVGLGVGAGVMGLAWLAVKLLKR